jgi:hypothetical protein
MHARTNVIVCRANPRHKSRERNSKRASRMRERHPPEEGIMSPKMHFRDRSRATKVPATKLPRQICTPRRTTRTHKGRQQIPLVTERRLALPRPGRSGALIKVKWLSQSAWRNCRDGESPSSYISHKKTKPYSEPGSLRILTGGRRQFRRHRRGSVDSRINLPRGQRASCAMVGRLPSNSVRPPACSRASAAAPPEMTSATHEG